MTTSIPRFLEEALISSDFKLAGRMLSGVEGGGIDVDKFKHKIWSRDQVCRYSPFPGCMGEKGHQTGNFLVRPASLTESQKPQVSVCLLPLLSTHLC